ncbi:MAG: hypothetical protein HY235_21730 [Acidobacteria bacterium]|nr:hypothetical protein [Acidobacteriota bacterium]
MNILARDVRNERLVAVPLRIEDENALLSELTSPEFTTAYVEPKFERHIKPRKRVATAEFDTGQIVDGQSTRSNDPHDSVQADRAGIEFFQSATRSESAGDDGENEASKSGQYWLSNGQFMKTDWRYRSRRAAIGATV